MSEKETTFENAKEGDIVYSLLFKCKNHNDKTNATISRIREGCVDKIEVMSHVDFRRVCFYVNGSFIEGGGQVLFWENPIREIPARPKRKVTKKGWIGICPLDNPKDGFLANTTEIFKEFGGLASVYNTDYYQTKEIEYDVEE